MYHTSWTESRFAFLVTYVLLLVVQIHLFGTYHRLTKVRVFSSHAKIQVQCLAAEKHKLAPVV
jgi:hypothetical protein